jgi:hypothetical protein
MARSDESIWIMSCSVLTIISLSPYESIIVPNLT